jgi:hypothetical protein
VESNHEEHTPQFPIGTIVYYGPDDNTVTKIQAGIVFHIDEPPLHRTWSGNDVTLDPIVLAELGQFFKEHSVIKVVMTSNVTGCPHEEGRDYPVGEECPQCPFWQTKKNADL